MNADDDISILNGLIGATMDSARHYRKVAGDIGNPRIRALFEHLSTQRTMIAQGLQQQLAAVSGNPQSESARAASRIFGNLRHAMNYGYCALVDEVRSTSRRNTSAHWATTGYRACRAQPWRAPTNRCARAA